MTPTTTGTTMTSGQTSRTARQAPGREHRREVCWLPGRLVGCTTATTAMIPAATVAGDGNHDGYRLWPHIQGRAARPGLTAPGAVTQAVQPPARPRRQHDRDGGRPDPGAGQ